jgi:N-acetylneuraminic acid mutarotase
MKKIQAYLLMFWCSACVIAQDWQMLPSFPGVERDDATGFVIDGDLYVGTGLSPWWSALADFYRYQSATNQWVNTAPLPSGAERQYASGFTLNASGYIFGGYNGTEYLNDLWRYDPSADVWFLEDSLPSFGRSGSASFVLNNRLYLMGGKHLGGAATDEVWTYDPVNFRHGTKKLLFRLVPCGGLRLVRTTGKDICCLVGMSTINFNTVFMRSILPQINGTPCPHFRASDAVTPPYLR